MNEADKAPIRSVKWIGSSKDDLKEFPGEVRREMGYALYLAQIGMKALKAKPLRGFGGATVLEVVENYDGETYRAVYTVKFQGVIFVLHVFQKKSKRGIQTPKADIDLIWARLKLATEAYNEFYRGEKP